MADDNRTRRFAVLIDADNTSPKIVAGLFEEIAKFGEASSRRIYGDFSSPRPHPRRAPSSQQARRSPS